MADVRARVAAALGSGYPGPGFGGVRVVARRDFEGWSLETLAFERGGEEISALFLRPDTGRVPAVIYAHAHGNRYEMGCAELVEGRPSLRGPYAADLRKLGIAALCIEMPCFGARQAPGEGARAKAALWKGETLWGQMLAEQRAGVDFLAGHPAVEPGRIGALGFSMGSTLAWWLAALDTRIRAASAQCSFADLETLIAMGAHDGHGVYMTVPGLLRVARSGEIAGLTAPRALQICAGMRDWSTPPEAFEAGVADLRAAYAGAEDQLRLHVEPEAGHEETPAMRAAVLAFLRERLLG